METLSEAEARAEVRAGEIAERLMGVADVMETLAAKLVADLEAARSLRNSQRLDEVERVLARRAEGGFSALIRDARRRSSGS